MKKAAIFMILGLLVALLPIRAASEEIDVLIKGRDDGVKTSKQQDYKEAVMNAKLEAIERAGVEISSITRVINFQTKFDMVESKAKAVLLPGFQVMDLGYQLDGTYLVVLSGKIQVGARKKKQPTRKIAGSPEQLEKYMIQAVKDGDYKTVKTLLEQDVHVNMRDDNPDAEGRTPLHWAASMGNVKIAKLLLKYGASINAREKDQKNTPLLLASRLGKTNIVKLLLKHGASLDERTYWGETPLILAAYWGKKDTVEFLLQKGSDPNARTGISVDQRKDGDTALHRAASLGRTEIVELLLKFKADPNIRAGKYGQRPLESATRNGQKDVVEILRPVTSP